LELVVITEDVCFNGSNGGAIFSCLKRASMDPKITSTHVETFSMIDICSPTKISMSLIVGWALRGFPWRLKLNVA
jgi:hypothetical protein